MSSLVVGFIKKNGKKFYVKFKSRYSMARAIRAWRNKGGKIAKTVSSPRSILGVNS